MQALVWDFKDCFTKVLFLCCDTALLRKWCGSGKIKSSPPWLVGLQSWWAVHSLVTADTLQPLEIASSHSVFAVPLDYTATDPVPVPNPHSLPCSVWSTFFQWVLRLMRLFHTSSGAACIPPPQGYSGGSCKPVSLLFVILRPTLFPE